MREKSERLFHDNVFIRAIALRKEREQVRRVYFLASSVFILVLVAPSLFVDVLFFRLARFILRGCLDFFRCRFGFLFSFFLSKFELVSQGLKFLGYGLTRVGVLVRFCLFLFFSSYYFRILFLLLRQSRPDPAPALFLFEFELFVLF